MKYLFKQVPEQGRIVLIMLPSYLIARRTYCLHSGSSGKCILKSIHISFNKSLLTTTLSTLFI